MSIALNFLLVLGLGLINCVPCYALLPPLAFMIKDVMENRKPLPIEIVMRHSIELQGEKYEVEERIVRDRTQIHALFRSGSQPTLAAAWEKQGYIFGRERPTSSRSTIFIKYLLLDSTDELRDALLTEQFIRRDQLFQYRPGYIPTGDPLSWDLQNNYMKHPDIFLWRLPTGIAIDVVGLDDKNIKRSVFFTNPKTSRDRVMGIARLEWKDDKQAVAWNFSQFAEGVLDAGRSRAVPVGSYPREMSLEVGGAELIHTQVLSWRPLRDRALAEFRTQWRNLARSTSIPSSMGSPLKLLLSYR